MGRVWSILKIKQEEIKRVTAREQLFKARFELLDPILLYPPGLSGLGTNLFFSLKLWLR